MSEKKNKTVIVYIDPYITDQLDELIKQSSNHLRGNLISAALSFFVFQGDAEVKKYIKRAEKFIKESGIIDRSNKFGKIRSGKVRVALRLKSSLADYVNNYDKKTIVLAALIFVKVINDKEILR